MFHSIFALLPQDRCIVRSVGQTPIVLKSTSQQLVVGPFRWRSDRCVRASYIRRPRCSRLVWCMGEVRASDGRTSCMVFSTIAHTTAALCCLFVQIPRRDAHTLCSALWQLLEQLTDQAVLSDVRRIAIDGTSATAILLDRRSGAILADAKLYNEAQPAKAVKRAVVRPDTGFWHTPQLDATLREQSAHSVLPCRRSCRRGHLRRPRRRR